MQRLRRSNSVIRDEVRQSSEGRRMERARSSNLASRPWRRLRRYWKQVIFGCGCITVALISLTREKPADPPQQKLPPSHQRICPSADSTDWASLPPDVELSVHVVARGNTNNLRTTLRSLLDACYPEDVSLPLHVWALTAHAREVLPAQDGFVWTPGTYQSRTISTVHGNVPPLEGWAKMWTDPSDKEVRLVLPEGLELSKLYFFWLSGTLARYLGAGVTLEERKIFRENVFGISLSATGLTEVSGKPYSWDTYEAYDARQPMFHTLPGSRGTAFFGWQWGDFTAFMDTRARALTVDSSQSESLLPTPGGSALPAWAGSLERFMTEFVHGRGLGILHPNLNGKVSFARRMPCETAEMVEREKEDPVEQIEPTSAPTLRGAEDVETREPLVETHKEATRALKHPPVSALPAYDILFRRHPDVTHLRLLSYRFMQRLQASDNRNEELESMWRRPEVPCPEYHRVKYLVYQPQFGMGNQLRALEAGLAVARILGRMLVVPDYISDNGEGLWVRYDAIWEYGFLEELVGRDKVILQKDFEDIFNTGKVITAPTQIFLVDMPIKQLTGTDEYFDRLGWGELPQRPLPLPNATEAGWRKLLELEDQVLAVSAMFGMFQGWASDSGVGNDHWHQMVKLHVSEEAAWLHKFVEDSLARFRQKATETHSKRAKEKGKVLAHKSRGTDDRWAGGAETEFMCAHIRRQDFEESCARYEEEYRSGSGRNWVVGALGSGGICWVEQDDFRKTVDIYLRRAPTELGVSPRFVFATSDDESFLEATKYGNDVPVFTLDDVSLPSETSGESRATGDSTELSLSMRAQIVTAEEVQAALPAIDVAVCSRAALLVLNYFSTYSALIKSKAKAQPNFVRGLYWADPPALSNWWTTYFGWLHRFYR